MIRRNNSGEESRIVTLGCEDLKTKEEQLSGQCLLELTELFLSSFGIMATQIHTQESLNFSPCNSEGPCVN